MDEKEAAAFVSKQREANVPDDNIRARLMKENVNDWLNEHGDYLYRFAIARLRDPHQAEDAVQETMLAAI